MALFSFGKKDKNPPETPASVAKAPPTPPKIQNPPAAGVTSSVPSVKPPQPSGLIPSTGMSARAATTQPMVMPRTNTGGLKPARPGAAQSSRSTQRIVLPPSGANAKAGATKTLSAAAPTGRINLPIGMILRCLPPEVLAADVSEFESSGAAATEIGLPMNMILGQLPSGKVEIALQDLVPHFPSGYLQPTDSIASYLPTLINLPLMDVVMRIPPDLLSLRPDQKDVDAAVINMADPFTEEILREQAEAARQAAAKANIIEENQVPPTEEFVPQAQATMPIPTPPAPTTPAQTRPAATPPVQTPPAPVQTRPAATPPVQTPQLPTNPATAAKTSLPLPLPRSSPMPMPPQRQPTSSLPKPPLPTPAVASPVPPMPQAHSLPTPNTARPASPAPPTSPNSTSRTISPSGRLPVPSRATTPIPTRPPLPSPMTNQTVPMPPSTRPTASVPAPPTPLPPQPPITSFAPPPAPVLPVAPPPPEGFSRRSPTGPVAMPPLPPVLVPKAPMVEISQPEPEPEPEPQPEPAVASAPPSAGNDDLAQLASLAMAQMGESAEEAPAEPVHEPEPEPVASTIPLPPEPTPEESAPVASAEPEPEPLPEPVPVEAPKPVAQAQPAPKPVTAPLPPLTPVEQPKTVTEPTPSEPEPEPVPQPAPSAAVALNLNNCTPEELTQIPGCTRELAAAIIHYRTKIQAFKKLEDLLQVPGMTKTAYTNLTGELPPSGEVPQTLNELLGFPPEQTITLKDVTDRIACWPDVTGCVLSQSSGLALVGSVPAGLDKSAIVAFVPRMFEAINKSFGEITGKETDELIIPTTGTSFNILRNKDLYLIILSRMPLMPERHLKVARFVLAGLSIREN